MNLERSYKYWAFISHSHADKRVARWLCRFLENQVVPRSHRAAVDGQERTFTPLFIDHREAGAAYRIDTEIEHALDISRNLIVICSPHAVASHYVNEEIAYFKSLGREKQIICLIASGTPNALPNGRGLECFPTSLRFEADGHSISDRAIPMSRRPLAASVGQESKAELRRAGEQVVLGLLDLTSAELHATRNKASR